MTRDEAIFFLADGVFTSHDEYCQSGGKCSCRERLIAALGALGVSETAIEAALADAPFSIAESDW